MVELKYLMIYLEENIDPIAVIERFPLLENDTWFALIIYPILALFIFFVYWAHIRFIQKVADILDSIIGKNDESQISKENV